MKHPEDLRTLELPGLEPKRGRGRPRKPDALTPAQRAKAYRDRRRLAKAKAPAPLIETLCNACGQRAVFGPRVSCAVCWPFPVEADGT